MNIRSFDRDEGIDGRGIANLILDNFDSQKFAITNLKINKLLFFAHGLHSVRFTTKLIRNHIEAWDNGPVVKVVYDAFKSNGRDWIRDRATTFDYHQNAPTKVSYEALSDEQMRFVIRVTDHYVRLSSSELVAMTHEPGTPWHLAFHEKKGADDRLRNRIPEEWIQHFFVDNFGSRRTN